MDAEDPTEQGGPTDGDDDLSGSSDDDAPPGGWIPPEKRRWIHPAELNRVLRALRPATRGPVTPQEQARRGAITVVAMVCVGLGLVLLMTPPPKEHPVALTASTQAVGWLGVRGADGPLTASLGGPVVEQVLRHSPAAAVLRHGDIILDVNATRTWTMTQLRSAIRQLHPGAAVELVVERDGQRQQVAVTLGKAP